jgi:hypothetical protein
VIETPRSNESRVLDAARDCRADGISHSKQNATPSSIERGG